MFFRIQQPDGSVSWIELAEDSKLRFGAHPKCDVALNGLGIHPIHFGVVERRGRYHLVMARNDDSLLSQKVELNGQVVRKARLRFGDEITVGDYLIETFDSESAAAEHNENESREHSSVAASTEISSASESELGLADETSASQASSTDSEAESRASWGNSEESLLDGGALQPLEDLADLDELGDPFAEDFDDPLSDPLQDRLATDLESLDPALTDGLTGGLGNPLLGNNHLEQTVAYDHSAAEQAKLDAAKAEAPAPVERGPGLFDSVAAKTWLVFLGCALPLGGLLLLVFRNLPYETQLYQDVMAAYKITAYDEAIIASDRYARHFPDGEHASSVAVQKGLSRLYQRIEYQATWPQMRQELDEVLKEWGDLRFHAHAQQGLADILPQMIDGFLAMAKSNTQVVSARAGETAIVNARHCVEIARQALPAHYQREKKLVERELRVARLERSIFGLQRQRDAIDKISASVDEGDFPKAYQTRDALLARYPDAADNTMLHSVMQRLASAEMQQAKRVKLTKTSADTRQFVTLAPTLPADPNPPLVFWDNASGMMCGINSTTGQLRWQRFVGFESFAPTRFRVAGKTRTVFYNATTESLECVDSAGTSVWQFACGVCKQRPIFVGDRIHIVSNNQSIQLQADNGQPTRAHEFVQDLACLAVEERTGQTVIVAGHSHLFHLTPQRRQVDTGEFLGHRVGEVAFPPVIHEGLALIVQREGMHRSKLIAASARSLTIGQQLRIPGRVVAPPVMVGDKLILPLEDRLAVIAVVARSRRPLTPVVEARLVANDLAVSQHTLWVAGPRTAALRIPQGAGTQATIVHDLHLSSQNIQVAGDHVLLVSDEQELMQFKTSDGNQVWKRSLPLPTLLSLWPGNDPTRDVAHVHRVPADFVSDTNLPTIRAQGAGTHRLVGSASGRRSLLVEQTSKGPEITPVDLPGALAIAPLEAANGLLLAIRHGPLFVFDPKQRQPVGTPLLPPPAKNAGTTWRGLWVGTNGRGIAMTDDQLIAIKIGSHGVASTKNSPLEAAPVTAFCEHAGSLWFVDVKNQLVTVALDTLETTVAAALKDDVVWGPQEIAGHLLVATAGGRLQQVEGGEATQSLQVTSGEVVGVSVAPLNRKGLTIATSGGLLEVTDWGQTGKSIVVETQRDLAGNPVMTDKGVLLSTQQAEHLIVPYTAIGEAQ